MNPIEYKLIPYPNQEGEWLIISDEGLKSEEWCLINDTDFINQPATYIIGKYTKMQLAGLVFRPDYANKIIGSSIEIDKSIPLIRREQINWSLKDNNEELYCLARNNSEIAFPFEDYRGKVIAVDDEHTGQALRGAYVEGFESGYNKHAETHPFTEIDLLHLINWIRRAPNNKPFHHMMEMEKKYGKEFSSSENILKEFLETVVDKSKREHNIKLEMIHTSSERIAYKPKVDKEGYINILSIS